MWAISPASWCKSSAVTREYVRAVRSSDTNEHELAQLSKLGKIDRASIGSLAVRSGQK